MSVVGFDVGSLRGVVAVARAGGVDVICNEVSERATPCLVSFDSKRRFIGDPARIQQMSNFRNTVSCINCFLGRNPSEPAILDNESKYWSCQLAEKDGECAARVNYLEEERIFSSTELMAMFLGKLKLIAQNETKAAVSDCVISVPVFFNEDQRRAMLDASAAAGLNCLRLLNDTTATALCYGLTKNDQFTEKPRTVCFIDIGYSGAKVAISSFTKGNLEIKGTSYDQNLGGRDFDEALCDFFADSIMKSHGEDIKSSKRGLLRLRTASEKIKKVLSAISSTKTDLETESRDFPLLMTRDHFESLIQPLLLRLRTCILDALQNAGLKPDDIDSIETVGGSTRIPAIKALISNTFDKEISTTLNQDEAVSRGCAFQCAIESPSVRVREFGIKDIISHSVKLSWSSSGESKEIEVFPQGSNLPSTKPLFMENLLPIEFSASYCRLNDARSIGKFIVSGAKIYVSSSFAKLRVDVAINGHGLFSVKKSLLIEEKMEEVPGEGPDSPPQQRKIIREHELNITSKTSSRSPKDLQLLKENEFALALKDKYAQELDDSRNALEEFIYELRSKLESAYKPFTLESDVPVILKELQLAEDWLYSDHESESKELYTSRLSNLKKLALPIENRSKEHERIPLAASLLRELISAISAKANPETLDDEDLQAIKKECDSKLAWLDGELAKLSQLPMHFDPILTSADINQQREKLLTVTSALLAKAKPAASPNHQTASPLSETTEPAKPDMDID